MKREYSLDELRLMFHALDAHERGDSDAMRGVGDPIVDQRLTAMQHGGNLSPAAREFPVVSEGLDRAQTVALNTQEQKEIRDRGSFLERRRAVLSRDGEPVVLVVLHCREWTYDNRARPASLAYVVPVLYSPEKFAREIARDTWACWLCERGQSYNCESFLMVSCGAIVHVMSACRQCRRELDHDGLDWAGV